MFYICKQYSAYKHKPKGLNCPMKLKKILTSLVAAAAVISTVSMTSLAVYDGEATYCFDNDSKLSEWQTYGSTAKVNFKMTHTTDQASNGNGCIVISESLKESLSDETFGGVYITADSLGIDSFGGCIISMSVLAQQGKENACENLSVFSDGMLWVNSYAPALSSTTWTTVTLAVPEGADNYRAGFTIPTFNMFTGELVYIDDFTVTLPDGKIISNVGDYQPKTINENNTVSTGTNIALIILLVVLVLAIIGAIGFIISNALKRFS